jgi:flagellar biosynthesis protein FlhG
MNQPGTPDSPRSPGETPDANTASDRSWTRVLAVASGKGGVGKTSVAVNLTFALAGLGRRTCLLDADLGLSNVDVLLGINPTVTLEQVLFEDVPMEQAVMSVRRGVDVISGSSGVSRMAELSRDRRMEMTREFHKLTAYDYLIVDNSPGITAQVISLCLSCGDVLVIINPEPSSITDAYALIKVFKENGLSKSPLVAINRAHSIQRAKRVFEQVHKTAQTHLGVDCVLAGIIPEDPALYRAASRQRPLVELEPGSLAAKAFVDLAQRIDVLGGAADAVFQRPEQFFDQSIIRFQQTPVLPPALAGAAGAVSTTLGSRDFRERLDMLLRQLLASAAALADQQPELARETESQIEALRDMLDQADAPEAGGGLEPEEEESTTSPAGLQDQKPRDRAKDEAAGQPRATDVTALLVCDNPSWRDILARILEDVGIESRSLGEDFDPARHSPSILVIFAEAPRPDVVSLLTRLPDTPALCLLPDRGLARQLAQALPQEGRRVIESLPIGLGELEHLLCDLLGPGDLAAMAQDELNTRQRP